MEISIPHLDSNLKDWIQAASWIAAVAAGLFGIIKIVVEMRHARELRQEDLRWKKAQAAKSLWDEMWSDEPSHAALTMLDWDGREFEIKEGTKSRITTKGMLWALRTENTEFSDFKAFIRDAFDNLFYYMGIFEHSITTGLVDFADLEHLIEYYVAILARTRPVFEKYVATYCFKRAAPFLGRFEAWRQASAIDKGAPNQAVQPTGSAGA